MSRLRNFDEDLLVPAVILVQVLLGVLAFFFEPVYTWVVDPLMTLEGLVYGAVAVLAGLAFMALVIVGAGRLLESLAGWLEERFG
jgi:hypothetical protein